MEWVRACVLSTGPQDNVGLAVFMERVRQVRTCRLRLATRCGQASAVREVCSATSFCAVSTRGQATGAEVDSRYVDSAETVKRQRYQDCTQSLHGTGRRAARTLVLSEPREDANAIGVRDKQVARTGAREPNSTPGSEPKAEKADRFGLLHCLRRVDRHWVQLFVCASCAGSGGDMDFRRRCFAACEGESVTERRQAKLNSALRRGCWR
ncbi:hypothetical protein ERJ75_000655300 [Trypanosoma vivax]|nr:hypothetical protein ERJ75_000655300 [Trypanosoma vivax]